MDISELIENVKNEVLDIKESIINFYEENKKIALLITGLIMVLFICLILLISIYSSNSKKKKDKEKALPDQVLTLSEELIIPSGPELPRDYNISREEKDIWTDNEADVWFTVPSQKEIDALSASNDRIVNEIIKAAP